MGAYHHELFVRDKPHLWRWIQRAIQRTRGNRKRTAPESLWEGAAFKSTPRALPLMVQPSTDESKVQASMSALSPSDGNNNSNQPPFSPAGATIYPSMMKFHQDVMASYTPAFSSTSDAFSIPPNIMDGCSSQVCVSNASTENECFSTAAANRGTDKNKLKKFLKALMDLLSQEDPEIVTWLPSGTAFIVRDRKKFVEMVLPRYFKQTKIGSFFRQLNMYGFRCIVDGPYMGAYHHELFVRDKPHLCSTIQRTTEKKVGNIKRTAHEPVWEGAAFNSTPCALPLMVQPSTDESKVQASMSALSPSDGNNTSNQPPFSAADATIYPSMMKFHQDLMASYTPAFSSTSDAFSIPPNIMGGCSSQVCVSNASTEDECSSTAAANRGTDENQQKPFLQALMDLLSQEDPDIVTWLLSGTAFIVKDCKKFVDMVLPRYFKQNQSASFFKELNMYGFRRIVDGPDMGAYHHELFVRDKPHLCSTIQRRTRINRKRIAPESVWEGAAFKSTPRALPLMVQPSTNESKVQAAMSALSPSDGSNTSNQPPFSAESDVPAPMASLLSSDGSNTSNLPPFPAADAVPSNEHNLNSSSGYSIIVCDHTSKSMVEVAHYATIPCDLQSFALGVGELLTEGTELHKAVSYATVSETNTIALGMNSSLEFGENHDPNSKVVYLLVPCILK